MVFLRPFDLSQVFLYTRILYVIGALVFIYECVALLKRRTYTLLVFFIALLIGYLFLSLIGQKFHIGILLYMVSGYGFSLVMLNHKISLKLPLLLYIAIISFYFYNLVIGVHPHALYALGGTGSQNSVSILVVAVTVFLHVAVYSRTKKVYSIPSIIAVILCVWAGGRSGIVSSLFMLIILSMVRFFQNKPAVVLTSKKGLFLIGLGMFALLLFMPLDIIVERFDYSWNRFVTEGVVDSARNEIMNDYTSQMDAISLIVGVDNRTDLTFDVWGGNLHNSFLHMHANYGLFSVLIMSVIIYFGLYKALKISFVFPVLLLTILLRVLTEQDAFPGVYDPLIYFLTFSNFHSSCIRGNSSTLKV